MKMRYIAKKHPAGGYAAYISGTRTYLCHSRNDNRLIAEQTALMATMTYHQDMIDAAWDKLVASTGKVEEYRGIVLEGDTEWCTKGDILA